MHLHWLVHFRYRSTPWGRLQTEIIPVVARVVAIPVPVLQVNPEVYPSDGGLCCISNLPCLATEFSPPEHWRCLCDSRFHLALSQHPAMPCNKHSSLAKISYGILYLSEMGLHSLRSGIPDICMQLIFLFFFKLLKFPVAIDGKWPA